MSETVPRTQWFERLQAKVTGMSEGSGRLHVVRETNSTQSSVKRLNAQPGDVVVAWNQTAGQGQRGRSWLCGTEGVAMTFVDRIDPNPAWSLLGAVVAAKVIEGFLLHQVELKWPNDVLVDGRKIAGILVVRNDYGTLIGIGLNVLQRDWPQELRSTAVSLHELGIEVDRVEVIETILEQWVWRDSAVEGEAVSEAVEFFKQRDCLTGRFVRLGHDRNIYSGRLKAIDPLRDLVIETASGEVRLPAATTAILEVIDES